MRPPNFNTHVTSRLILLLFLLYRVDLPNTEAPLTIASIVTKYQSVTSRAKVANRTLSTADVFC